MDGCQCEGSPVTTHLKSVNCKCYRTSIKKLLVGLSLSSGSWSQPCTSSSRRRRYVTIQLYSAVCGKNRGVVSPVTATAALDVRAAHASRCRCVNIVVLFSPAAVFETGVYTGQTILSKDGKIWYNEILLTVQKSNRRKEPIWSTPVIKLHK